MQNNIVDFELVRKSFRAARNADVQSENHAVTDADSACFTVEEISRIRRIKYNWADAVREIGKVCGHVACKHQFYLIADHLPKDIDTLVDMSVVFANAVALAASRLPPGSLSKFNGVRVYLNTGPADISWDYDRHAGWRLDIPEGTLVEPLAASIAHMVRTTNHRAIIDPLARS